MIRSLLTLVMVVLALMIAPLAHAQSFGVSCPGVVRPLIGKGFQAITVTSSTAVALTVPSGSSMAVVTVEVAAVRFRDDGTAPTSSVGTLVNSGGTLLICSTSVMSTWSVIALSTTATLDVNYYGN